MKYKSHGRGIDTIFVLIIFSTFALSVLMVLTLGAGIYKNINDITNDSENERIALSYVRTKVRNFDNAGAVYIAPFFGEPALYIEESIGSTQYKTVIYFYDGWLCEMFCEKSLDFKPEAGMRVSQVENLHFGQIGNAITGSAGNIEMLLTPRSSNRVALPENTLSTGSGGTAP